MATRSVQESSLTSLADAIRAKGGTSDTLAFPSGFVEAIEAIQTGGGSIENLLFGLPYATGSFTAAEDITSTYTICTLPDSVLIAANNQTAIIGTFCIWCVKSPNSTWDWDIKGLDIGIYSYSYVGKSKKSIYAFVYATTVCTYGDGVIGFSGKDVQIKLTSSLLIPAGRNYNWLYIPFVFN